MKKLLLILAAAGALVAAGSAQVQVMMGDDSPYQYVTRKDVKDDLKLSDDQNIKILAAYQDLGDARQAAFQQAFQDARANGGTINYASLFETVQKGLKPNVDKFHDVVKATLTADQAKRMLQIYIQIQGDASLENAEVQKLVGLTDDQLAKIKDLQSKMADANKALAKRFQDKDIDGPTAFADYQENNEALKTALGKIPTDAQKKKFTEAQGPKFTLDPSIPLTQFGRRQTDGGGPGGRGGGN